jgi:hypothetical protein
MSVNDGERRFRESELILFPLSHSMVFSFLLIAWIWLLGSLGIVPATGCLVLWIAWDTRWCGLYVGPEGCSYRNWMTLHHVPTTAARPATAAWSRHFLFSDHLRIDDSEGGRHRVTAVCVSRRDAVLRGQIESALKMADIHMAELDTQERQH